MSKIHDIFSDRSWRVPEPTLTRDNTALLLIDLQYYDAHPDYGVVKEYRDMAVNSADYYLCRLRAEVIPNACRLLALFRQANMEVIHTRIQSLTRDGRDRSLEHKNLGIHVLSGSREAEFLAEVAPAGDEIIMNKTSGSAFNGSNLDYVLRNAKIENLVVCGVVTSGCVELTSCDAVEKGYGVIVVQDAVAAWTAEMDVQSLRRLADSFARVKPTAEVLNLIESLPAVKGPANSECGLGHAASRS